MALFVAAPCVWAGCANKTADAAKLQRAVEKATPAPVERPSEEEAADEATPPNAAPDPGETATSNAAVIDPSRIPVEEDFETEAANRITKNANLELELARISNEIKSGAAPAAPTKSKKN